MRRSGAETGLPRKKIHGVNVAVVAPRLADRPNRVKL
jgi:hypothetical protein